MWDTQLNIEVCGINEEECVFKKVMALKKAWGMYWL